MDFLPMNKTVLMNCRGKYLSFDSPVVMGILNVTPDSFYDGNKYNHIDLASQRVEEMVKEGAKIIDIGGMSSRPGSDFVSIDEEQNRVIPILKQIRKLFPDIIISLDTFRAEIAKIGLEEGVDIINDISAGELDSGILNVVSKYKAPYIFMHMNGIPKNMQDNPLYDNVVGDVLQFMFRKVRNFRSLGIENLIGDPGFGFGKTIDDNYNLLNKLDVFKILEIPILVGISRKSMLYKYLRITPEDSLNATSAMHVIAMQKGANILRVHDVKEAVEVVKLHEKLYLFNV